MNGTQLNLMNALFETEACSAPCQTARMGDCGRICLDRQSSEYISGSNMPELHMQELHRITL